jgi:hypothetical protein
MLRVSASTLSLPAIHKYPQFPHLRTRCVQRSARMRGSCHRENRLRYSFRLMSRWRMMSSARRICRSSSLAAAGSLLNFITT